MKIDQKYGSVLKKLLCFTDTKFMVLSKALGYDISYISKWCNNIKIPTTKNIEIINEKASVIFAEEIVKKDKINEFYETFNISEYMGVNDLNATDVLEDQIYRLLDNAYKITESNSYEKLEKRERDTKVIVGKNESTNFIKDIIQKTIEESTEDIEFISTLDICKSTSNINLDIIEEFKCKDIRITAKVGFDMDEFERNPNFYLWRIYIILNKRWNVEFKFF
ncbi:hypothetical protein [Clostridium novyi]|uniref:hypothetical protein n=1 Tax=Clostridium novyi TaxID=1542 RepID=UPI000A7B67D8|nr:hypothetical protein [Clostridium novyi]